MMEKTEKSIFDKMMLAALGLAIFAIATVVIVRSIKGIHRPEKVKHMNYKEAITDWVENHSRNEDVYEPLNYQCVDSLYADSLDNKGGAVLEKVIVKHDMTLNGNSATLYFIYNDLYGIVEGIKLSYDNKEEMEAEFDNLINSLAK